MRWGRPRGHYWTCRSCEQQGVVERAAGLRCRAGSRLGVEEAAAELAVSSTTIRRTTIRRDFDQPAEQQMLVPARGGAIVHGASYELPLRCRTARPASEKSVNTPAVQPQGGEGRRCGQ
jgi:DeoR family transcriptional regulator of aga operon